jgi:putative spermidine/putrescine transport system ATP-binding protein
LPLGPSVVHEVRLADGQTVKIAEQRAAGSEPRASGGAVRVVPRPGSVFVFPEARPA